MVGGIVFLWKKIKHLSLFYIALYMWTLATVTHSNDKGMEAMAIHLSPENMLLDVTVVIYTIVYIHLHSP